MTTTFFLVHHVGGMAHQPTVSRKERARSCQHLCDSTLSFRGPVSSPQRLSYSLQSTARVHLTPSNFHSPFSFPESSWARRRGPLRNQSWRPRSRHQRHLQYAHRCRVRLIAGGAVASDEVRPQPTAASTTLDTSQRQCLHCRENTVTCRVPCENQLEKGQSRPTQTHARKEKREDDRE